MDCMKMSITRNQILFFAAIIYTISWFIPIEGLSGMKGYRGAQFANDILTEYLEYFYNVIFSNETITLSKMIEAFSGVVYGVPNILFIVSLICTYRNTIYSLYFILPCTLTMILWGGDIIIGGVRLWALSGVIVLFVAIKIYKTKKSISNKQLIISSPFLFSYGIVGLLITNNLLND